jgi:hypothetical protein
MADRVFSEVTPVSAPRSTRRPGGYETQLER